MTHFIRRSTATIYAIGHLFVDFSCALILITKLSNPSLFLLYNFLAFAVQMPIGILADILGRNRHFALAGILMVAAAFLPLPLLLRVILCGFGNACYHVGGGREALLANKNMTCLGIFVAPGAVGIYLGSILAGNKFALICGAVLTSLCGIAIILGCSNQHTPANIKRTAPTLSALMLIIVIIRSLVGMCMQTPWKLGLYIPLAAILSAAGKAAGGFLGDRFGGKRIGAASLLLAALLFAFPNFAMAGVLATFLFNMSMPITLRKAANSLQGYEGFAFGLLTFGLFLGYLPNYHGVHFSAWIGVALSLLSAGLFLLESNHD